MTKTVVCIAGDGIGPEVTDAMKTVVAATGAPIEWIDAEAGLGALKTRGAALPQATVDLIAAHRLAIKGPTATPKGEGHSSVNVRLRKIFDLHVGYRPYLSLPLPGVTERNRIDLHLFRQNTEGLYDCSEELIEDERGKRVVLTANFTDQAMERLAKRVFDFAARAGRKRVTLVTKSNIHKAWGKLYHDAFMRAAADFSGIEAEEVLVDAAAMQLAMNPRRFDVIVTENLCGDILSDLCAGIIGGLGVAPGANLGDDRAIFEAVHGTADDIAGQDKANPAALILSAAMMLDRLDYGREAQAIRIAVHGVVAAGRHVTGDLLRFYPQGTMPCGTRAFTQAVISRIPPS